jgi:hypothetical protein
MHAEVVNDEHLVHRVRRLLTEAGLPARSDEHPGWVAWGDNELGGDVEVLFLRSGQATFRNEPDPDWPPDWADAVTSALAPLSVTATRTFNGGAFPCLRVSDHG